MPRITVKTLNDEIKRFGITPDDKQYVPALILLSSAVKGPNADRIAKFINKPRSEVREVGKRLRDNGIWNGGKLCCGWFGKDGGLEFCLDVNVACGFLNRVKE